MNIFKSRTKHSFLLSDSFKATGRRKDIKELKKKETDDLRLHEFCT